LDSFPPPSFSAAKPECRDWFSGESAGSYGRAVAIVFGSGFRGGGDILLNMSDTDLQLLARYTQQHAEDAFAELVRRHLDLVLSAALRQVRSPQLAEEVAQSAFTDLARQAHRLAPDTILTAWLYQVTRRTAIDVVRREARRQLREQVACELSAMNTTAADWIHIEPLLDEAMHALDDTDRTAILLRYFENKSLREVGQTLGTNEDAARKRVSRAVERLREFFAKRGVTIGARGLVVLISTNAVQAAPVGLAVTISAAALAGTTLATTATAIATKAIAMTTLQKAIVTATIAAAVGAGIYEARQASHLRDQVQTLQQQQTLLAEQITQLKSGNEGLSNRVAQANQSRSLSTDRLRELLRLRGEVGLLRRQQRETPGGAGQPAVAVAAQPIKPAPFQLQLVLDEPGESTEPMTNNARGAGGETLYLQKAPLLDYTAIRSATVTRSESSGAPEISIEFSDVGKELFADITRENLNKRLAIVLNGHLYSAPVIRSEIPGGKALITGSFTEAEASELAAKINDAVGGP
jgi:RNA polymerase sigma factor (sigma-70 family)